MLLGRKVPLTGLRSRSAGARRTVVQNGWLAERDRVAVGASSLAMIGRRGGHHASGFARGNGFNITRNETRDLRLVVVATKTSQPTP